MKTIRKVLVVIMGTCLMMACSKTDDFMRDDLSGDPMKAKPAAQEKIFDVLPNGFDDTQNLKDAFADAISYGPGAVVQLVEGEYFLGFIEIRDFEGSFRGAGKDKTVITAMNNLDGQALWDQNLHAALVKFVGGDVNLSHFTIQTPPGKLTVSGPPLGNLSFLINFSAKNAVYEAENENRSINVVIDHVCFKGHLLEGGPGYRMGYNCFMGVRAGLDFFNGADLPREKIDFKMTNSEINTFCYGLVLEEMTDSKLIVGEKNKGNVFSNTDQAGGVWQFRNMEILMEGNTFNVPEFSWGFDLSNYAYYGSFLMAEPQINATLCNIQNNVFNLTHAEYALYFADVRRVTNPEEMPVIFQVRNNQFNMTDGYEWSIISLLTKGMVIRNNKFSGIGDLAVYIENWYGMVGDNVDGLILGNNFSKADLSTGAIYLSPATKNWSVVGGGNNKDQVINLGVDNIITGVNVSTSDIPLGRTIHEKLPPMNHIMH